jgi:hypothetical protein
MIDADDRFAAYNSYPSAQDWESVKLFVAIVENSLLLDYCELLQQRILLG